MAYEDIDIQRSPRSYLIPAILVTLFAFMPVGIIAIIFASKVKTKYNLGDFYGAEAASRTARNMCILGTGIAFLYYAFFVFTFLSIFNLSSNSGFEKTIRKAKQSEAKTYIGTINEAQKHRYLNKGGKFVTNFSELKVEFPPETTNYKYSIKTDQNKTISTATAKNDNLKSYTGAVFTVKTTEKGKQKVILIKQLCESNEPSKIPPAEPILVGSEVKCASGSTTFDKTYK